MNSAEFLTLSRSRNDLFFFFKLRLKSLCVNEIIASTKGRSERGFYLFLFSNFVKKWCQKIFVSEIIYV